ncbi:hypothetical protein NBRC116594_09290 [Shimia sp. NS0008-38b]|uniref:Pvc16 family protein n=1 Tax=Shimia sp. NS0008-38b TaxID=3127653 RepID=UPI00310BB26B
MAAFENLHDVGLVLAGYLRRNLTPALADILAAPPIENASSTAEAMRVSLMWVTPQPTHRNDPWVTNTEGLDQPPPVTLSGFFLITAYGTTDTGEPSSAINRLGQAIQVFETGPILSLPLSDDPATPGIDPTPGTGDMTVVFVPSAADLMEKIYTPLQMRHRPWALFEVGPIQLQRLTEARPGPDIVQPGGVRLANVAPSAPPRILRALPDSVRAGGRVMLETVEAGNTQSLRIGPREFTFTDAPAAPNEISRPDPDGRVWITLDTTDMAGDFDAVLRGAQLGSDPEPLTIDPANTPGLDAPRAAYSLGNPLTLTGGNLTAAERVFFWPEAGIRGPDEVIDLPPTAVTPNSVLMAPLTMNAAGLRTVTYRVSLRMATGLFTPFVLLEVTP